MPIYYSRLVGVTSTRTHSRFLVDRRFPIELITSVRLLAHLLEYEAVERQF